MKIYEAKTVFTCVCEDAEPRKTARAQEIVDYMRGAFNTFPLQEQFWILFLNRKNFVTGRQMITVGTLTAAMAHPREVFRAVILAGCSAFVCVHNHPSGDPTPSGPDLNVTRLLREGAKILDIELIDHVIIGETDCDPLRRGYYSFREAGML